MMTVHKIKKSGGILLCLPREFVWEKYEAEKKNK